LGYLRRLINNVIRKYFLQLHHYNRNHCLSKPHEEKKTEKDDGAKTMHDPHQQRVGKS